MTRSVCGVSDFFLTCKRRAPEIFHAICMQLRSNIVRLADKVQLFSRQTKWGVRQTGARPEIITKPHLLIKSSLILAFFVKEKEKKGRSYKFESITLLK